MFLSLPRSTNSSTMDSKASLRTILQTLRDPNIIQKLNPSLRSLVTTSLLLHSRISLISINSSEATTSLEVIQTTTRSLTFMAQHCHPVMMMSLTFMAQSYLPATMMSQTSTAQHCHLAMTKSQISTAQHCHLAMTKSQISMAQHYHLAMMSLTSMALICLPITRMSKPMAQPCHPASTQNLILTNFSVAMISLADGDMCELDFIYPKTSFILHQFLPNI